MPTDSLSLFVTKGMNIGALVAVVAVVVAVVVYFVVWFRQHGLS